MLIGRAQSFTQPAVYLLKVSDLYYVGSTSNLKNRVRQHVDMLRKGTHRNPRLQAMWDKHNSMEVRVIAAVDETQLLFYEQQWVNILRRHRNVANFGSEVSRPRLGEPRYDSAIRAIELNAVRPKALEALRKRYKEDKEFVSRMSENGRRMMKRLRATPEIEAKRKARAAEAQRNSELSERRRQIMKRRFADGFKFNTIPVNKIAIENTDTGERFSSITDAANAYNVGVPTVHRWVFGRKDGNRPKPPKPNWRVING